jgi:hypothetical protein
MERAAVVTFDTTSIPNPDNAVPGGYFVWLTKNNQTVAQQTISATDSSASFVIKDSGVYIARVVRLTASGSSIGSAAESEPVAVTPDMIKVPLTVTLVIADQVEPATIPFKVA